MFAKACEIFILDLTLRAWIHTEESKRRTLQVRSVLKIVGGHELRTNRLLVACGVATPQRVDVATAISKTDMFDFLIDIVPRDDLRARRTATVPCSTSCCCQR